MDSVVETPEVAHVETEVLPAVADALREWFPELGDRALAVTDAKITKENLPTLPIAMVAPLRQLYSHNSGGRLTVGEEFMIEIWLAPEREVGVGGETPFWSYYNFNALRNRLFDRFAGWRTPQNGAVVFVSLDIEVVEYAVMLSFRMRANYDICADAPVEPPDGEPARITYSLCAPQSLKCGDYAPEHEIDPCVKQ